MKLSLIIIVALVSTGLSAQTGNDDFEAFRRNIIADYQQFRKDMLDDYAAFLDGEWRERDLLGALIRGDKPKPIDPPRVEPDEPKIDPVNVVPVEPTPQPEPQPIVPQPEPVCPPEPIVVPPTIKKCVVDFYGQQLRIVQADINMSGATTYNYGEYWNRIDKSDDVKTVLADIRQTAEALQLNDWLKIELIRSYCKSAIAKEGVAARMVMLQYLASHLGYDVYLARSGQTPIVLISFEQIVYGHSFLKMGNGNNLYTFCGDDWQKDRQMSIEMCDLPEGEKMGKSVDLVMQKPLRIDGPKRSFNISYGRLSIRGEVNNTVMKIADAYPAMPIPEYARCRLDMQLRNSVCSQLRDQVRGMNKADALNALLGFVQHAFDYATDDVQFGREKTFFFEEMLFYPKCDCEDRSVFFAYLAKEILGIDNVLVNYPGHESTAVAVPINGHGFTYMGTRYISADPTYIGASVGQCMPQFVYTQPKVEEWY